MQAAIEMNVRHDLSICQLNPACFLNRMCHTFLWTQTERSELSFAFEQPHRLRLPTLCSSFLGLVGKKMFKRWNFIFCIYVATTIQPLSIWVDLVKNMFKFNKILMCESLKILYMGRFCVTIKSLLVPLRKCSLNIKSLGQILASLFSFS